MAYATERTLILKSKGWRYHKNGWEEVFKPLSDTCTTSEGASHANWGNGHYNTQVVDLPIIDSLNPRPAQLPLAIPEDLAPRLKRLHGDPITWWVGQFLKYLLRYQPETQQIIDIGMEKLGFQTPIVGVHIRRTDKVGTEAALHNVEEYMKHVDEYYDQLEMVQSVDKRRVFLASDDPRVSCIAFDICIFSDNKTFNLFQLLCFCKRSLKKLVKSIQPMISSVIQMQLEPQLYRRGTLIHRYSASFWTSIYCLNPIIWCARSALKCAVWPMK